MNEIDVIKTEIQEVFKEDYSGHDFWHSIRVYKVALQIAETEKCNKRLVALAALLHDVDDVKLFASENYQNARKIMALAKVEPLVVEKVIHIIRQVSFKGRDSVVPDSIEGKIVQDADRLDAMGAIGIARAFAYGGVKGRVLYDPAEVPCTPLDQDMYLNNQSCTINHFHEKLFLLKGLMNTACAKLVAEKRDKFLRQYYQEFMEEWEGI